MWKLSIEDDQTNKTVVNLVRDEYSIGRGEENTVRLTERNISRRHAKLTRNGVGWILDDLASYNGCFVNGVRVSEPQKLEHGDLVQVGDYRLEITDEQVAQATYDKATVPGVPRAQSLTSQPDRLVMLAGPTPGAEFALAGQRIVIGRGEECEISVNHASVSRVHAEIHALGDGRYEIVDRESANGLRVNGVDLKRSLMDARDTIELGDVVFKFIPAGQIYHPGADPTTQMIPVGAALQERHTPAPGVGMERRAAATAGIPPILKAVAGLAFLGVLVMIGMVALGNRQSADGATQSSDPTSQVLIDALGLVQNGDVEGAHNKITSEIPENSNARQSNEFKDIEARWADMLLDLASRETDPQKKRALLERVAKTTSVDSGRRKRANNEIAALDRGVDPTELPSAPKPEGTITADPTTGPAPALSGGIVRNDPFAGGEKPAPTAKTPKKGPEPTGTKPKPTGTEPGPGLEEKDLGDRQKLTAHKNSLKGKAAAGKATDSELRMLKALCRQLGDMSCVN